MRANGHNSTTLKSLLKRLSYFKPFGISVIAICGGLLWVKLYSRLPISFICPFKAITHIPCPGCGGTRAVALLLEGQFFEALVTNPLSVVIFLFFCIAPIWTLIDGLTGKATLKEILTKRWNNTALIITFSLILINWIWNIIKHV